jgi:hypothetical protein
MIPTGPSIVFTLTRAFDRVRMLVAFLNALLLDFLALLFAGLVGVLCLRGRPPSGRAKGDEQNAECQSMSHYSLLYLH